MKKRILVLLVLLYFLSQFDTVKAQSQVYLPIILSSGENMANLAVLEITDGTTSVNLLSKEKEAGFHLVSWRPQIIQPKGGGVYQDSDIAPGRDLVFAVDGTANEVFNVTLNGDSQDDLIKTAQDLLRLLTKARDYSLTSWQDTPVYIKARAACETNTRYALIKNFTIQDVDNPYSQPFFTANQLVAMNNITIGIERGHWLGSAPGSGECAEISSIQEWDTTIWAVSTTSPVLTVNAMIQTTTGRIIAVGDNGNLWKSDDDGATWQSIATSAGVAFSSVIQITTGRILAGANGDIWKSDDDGATWQLLSAVPSTTVVSFLQLENGRILAGEQGQITYSDDNSATWAVLTTDPDDWVYAMLQTSSGRILAGDDGAIWKSDDNGDTWQLAVTFIGYVECFIQTSTGRILAGALSVWSSTDDGKTWSVALDEATVIASMFCLIQLTNGVIFGGDFGQIWKSQDDGITWVVETILPTDTVLSLLQSSTGKTFAGEVGQILELPSLPFSDMGAEASCSDIVYTGNHQNVANLTNIYRDDGGVFSANLFPMTLPTTLLPAVPAVNDAVYFGINTSAVNSGPFTSLVFDISVSAVSTTSYTITWEYYNGAAWAALTVRDGTNSGTGVFRALGVNSVHWTPPSNWATVAVNGVTGYWVRARVSALVGTLTPPVQQNRNIYSVVNGYIEIASTEVLGDIPALAQILAHNRSDLDGPGGSAPNLYENRLIVGLRSYNRGPTFQAYLNAADEQNPFGLTVSVGTNTTFGNDINAPTGRSATYNPAGVEAMATRVTFAFGPTIARDYYGTYHAFVRAYRDGGSSTDFTVRLQVVNGSGGVSYTTDTAQLQTTTRFEVLDFGIVKLPATGALGFDELGDTSEIRVQASAANAAVNLIIYDLILIPTDEYAIDSNDKTNSTLSDVGKSGGYDKVLNIDSITKPKFPIRSVVERYGSNLITAIYNSITPGEVILQANAKQRLWFFAMTTSATGTSYSWLSQPEISHSLQVYKQQRYLSLRGAR